MDQTLPTIAGLVTDSDGNPLSNIPVSLTGDRTLSTQTDSNGQFKFVNLLVGGNYTVSPVQQGSFSFTPASQSFTNLQADQAQVFTAAACGLSLSTSSAYFTQSGGAGNFQINAASGGCGWAISTDAPWITITSPTSGGGNSAVQYQVAANNTGTNRTATINVNGQLIQVTQTATANLIDDATFFVRQYYLDFLNREPDADGLDFWTNQITSCNGDPSCIDIKRQNVSAAYFLSREFQETGFFVIKVQRVAFGRVSNDATKRISYSQFLTDARAVGNGFIDGQTGADAVLDQNKTDYVQSVVTSSAFTAQYPSTLTAAQFVDALYQTANVTPQGTERQDAITAFGAGDLAGRAASLRKVAESNSVKQAEFNAAFVLLQYFGYLRRNPTDPPDNNDLGYQFWLNKLNQANGDYISSQMVRSFIVSQEYRKRFDAQ